jgi:uncharacterized heparinase superfamily protein
MNQAQLIRYFNTVRYLKFKQIFFRLYYACRRPAIKLPPKLISRSWACHWESPAVLLTCLSNSGEFVFQGKKGLLEESSIWNATSYTKLWLYNLHYFDELHRIGADVNREILYRYIANWIDNNPPCEGVGWEPYPLSVRLVNWVKWFSAQDKLISQLWSESLAIQANALIQQIEYHNLGNHLFANGKALVFVGTYFAGKQADIWLKKGLNILDYEIKEQFLADGGHFELSPMYHAIMVWDMCDLVNLAVRSNSAALLSRKVKWMAVIERGLEWLAGMSHPDGDISFFNDSAFGIAPKYADVLLYAQQLGIFLSKKNDDIPLQWLKESGYCVVNLQNNSKAILDVAKIGPDYQPGHAHADTLSFELSIHAQRFLINSGISQYGEGDLRYEQRSTKAHNTVCINGKNSSDIWGGFRVGKRAYPSDLSVNVKEQDVLVRCAHDGYSRSSGQIIHHREWFFSKTSLILRDGIIGHSAVAEARFYFHPNVSIVEQGKDFFMFCLAGGQKILLRVDGGADIRIEKSNWYPFFEVSIENKCLVVIFKENNLELRIDW